MKLMNKLLLAVTAAIAVQVATAEDSFLYWMVSPDVKLAGENDDFAYARVNVGGTLTEATGDVAGGTWLTLYSNGSAQDKVTAMSKAVATGGATQWGVIPSGYESSTPIIFELFNSNYEAVGWNAVTAGELAKYIGTASNPATGTYTLTSVVPEPASGLLMLLGLAGLALKRKRA